MKKKRSAQVYSSNGSNKKHNLVLLAILPKPIHTLQIQTHLYICSDNSQYMYKKKKRMVCNTKIS